MRARVPATAQVPSFGATVLMGPTHPEPSFRPFVTLVGSAKANAEVHESTRVVARSRRRMTDLTMRSRAASRGTNAAPERELEWGVGFDTGTPFHS